MIFFTKQLHLLLLCTFPGFSKMSFSLNGKTPTTADSLPQAVTCQLWYTLG